MSAQERKSGQHVPRRQFLRTASFGLVAGLGLLALPKNLLFSRFGGRKTAPLDGLPGDDSIFHPRPESVRRWEETHGKGGSAP